MSDAALLEMAAKDFRENRNQETFNKFMTVLENSSVVIPVLMPKDIQITPIMKAAAKDGRPVPLTPDDGTALSPCLLKKKDGSLSMPVFASIESIPADKKFPAAVTVPFTSCVSMIIASGGKVAEAVFDPFTEIVVLNDKLIKAVADHRKAAAEQKKNPQTKTVTMTAAQFASFVQMRVSAELLPKMLFAAPQEALRKLQKDKGSVMLELYASAYPKDNPCPCSEEDFSVMTLNITEEVQITRIDLPEKYASAGVPLRIYVTWKNEKDLDYFLIEKGDESDNISRITSEIKHEIIRPVCTNSTEIEDVLGIVK